MSYAISLRHNELCDITAGLLKEVSSDVIGVPLVFAASGGMGKAATVFYKWLAVFLVQK